MNHVDSPAFNLLSLCTGIGGLDLGVELAVPGARTVCGVEREGYCVEVLARRMEEKALAPFPVWSDLRTFDGKPWRGVVDCLTAGYPCQPFSVAGKRRGADDPRHLWPHVARIIRECGAPLCFLENVGGHLRLGACEVIRELHQMGYRTAAGLFTASEVGATHRRERLFILANRECGGGERWGDAGIVDSPAGSEPCEAHERQRDGDSADGCGSDVGHADVSRRETAVRGTGQHERLVVESADNDLANSNEPRLQRHREHGERAGECTAGSCSCELGTTPLFPPGPGDLDAWRAVLQHRPDLAPASIESTATESRLRELAHGTARTLDGGMNAIHQGRASKELQSLWEAVVSQAHRRKARRLWGLRSSEVLRSFVHGGIQNEGEAVARRIQEAHQAFEEECLRALRRIGEVADSPQEPGLVGQLNHELGNPLRDMPYEGSLGGGGHQLNQMDRLRCLGNGVVPLQAAHAFRTLARELLT